MNLMSLINQNKNTTTSTSHNNNNNYKMSIHLLLNAADELDKNGQQVQQQQLHKPLLPTVLIPSIDSHFKQQSKYLNNEMTESSSYYYYSSPHNLQFNKTSDTELEAIEFLSKINHINNNINNVFQNLKRQNSLKWNQSSHQNNIHELNQLSQLLINVCHETKKKFINNSSNDNRIINNINSYTLPFTVNNKNDNDNNYHISKRKLETVHSVNVIKSNPDIVNNQEYDINRSGVNLTTNFKINKKMISKKKITHKVGNNFSNIKRNHEMDGKPCSHCLSIEKTPEWRSGPYGSEQKICNACGLFYRKLKQKFGIDKANTIMVYRKLKCATNRRVPSEFDVPLGFISEQPQQEKQHTESWCDQKNQTARSKDVKNTQLVSPVVTPVIKDSIIPLNSNDLSSKDDPHNKPANSFEIVFNN